jgi:hypothetical protein
MSRATRRRSACDEEPEREDAPVKAPDAGVADLLRLQRTAGNRAVAQLLARNQAGASPVKDRKPIDDLAQQTNLKPVDRVKAYAKIAGTAAVNMDPAVVSDSGLVKDGLNLVSLKQASDVPAKTDFVDSAGRASGGAPPETATGVGAGDLLVDVLREGEAVRLLLPVGQVLEREPHQPGVHHLVADRRDHVVLILEPRRRRVHEDGDAMSLGRDGSTRCPLQRSASPTAPCQLCVRRGFTRGRHGTLVACPTTRPTSQHRNGPACSAPA